jgi:hypothetical protein
MDMNTLEFAQITGLRAFRAKTIMFLRCVRIPFAYPCYVAATLLRGTMKHRTAGTWSAAQQKFWIQLSSRVLCEKKKKQEMKICQSRNMSVCFAVRWWQLMSYCSYSCVIRFGERLGAEIPNLNVSGFSLHGHRTHSSLFLYWRTR